VSKAEQEYTKADDKHLESVRAFQRVTARIRTLRRGGTQAELDKAYLDRELARSVKDATEQEKERKLEI
jgi:hypothetical protein